ncbi:MAG: ParB/RepB/Spo0J family partition protein [Dehalococcoidia bacterium]
MKKTSDIRDTVLAGLGTRKITPDPSSPVPARRESAYIASFGRNLNEGLKDQIARLESERSSGFVVLKLDPKCIGASAFANRDGRSLDASDQDLEALKVDIRLRGQLEPIRVRPAAPDSGFEYEIVYGHRRHAACLALDRETEGGWPVLALLDAQATDVRDHVLKMYVENAARKDLSAYETGAMFSNWLREQVFPNQTELGAAVGLSQGTVAKYLTVASLPEAVVSAFGDPRVISLRWSEQLAGALRDRSSALLEAAGSIATLTPRPAPDDVLRRLLTAGQRGAKRPGAVRTETVKYRGRTLYKIAPRGNGLQISFGGKLDPKLAQAAQHEVKEALTRFLAQQLKDDET